MRQTTTSEMITRSCSTFEYETNKPQQNDHVICFIKFTIWNICSFSNLSTYESRSSRQFNDGTMMKMHVHQVFDGPRFATYQARGLHLM